MIDKALILIQSALDKYIKQANGISTTDPSEPAEVVLANIAKIEETAANDADFDPETVIMSLVNLEEEQTLKNVAHYQSSGSQPQYKNPPVNINLYILFSANHTKYLKAIGRLSDVITFFQGQTVFSLQTTPPKLKEGDLQEFEGIRLNIELYTLTFEQINYLWGSLGGKQVPFVMYRARFVSLQDDRPPIEGPGVTVIDTTLGGN